MSKFIYIRLTEAEAAALIGAIAVAYEDAPTKTDRNTLTRCEEKIRVARGEYEIEVKP